MEPLLSLPSLPIRGPLPQPAPEKQFRLLMGLVDKVKALPGVRVKSIPFELDDGTIVRIPGPWAYTGDKDREDEDLEAEGVVDSESSDSDSEGTKFVARNEFGHIRFANFLHRSSAGEIGGHCVLPPDAFKTCLASGWGSAHPFAGRFHPIVGSVVPETTCLFPAPRSAAEAEVLWSIIEVSYHWASKAV